MANFYTDNPDLKHHLTHPMMRKIVELKERNYTEAEKYDFAPINYDDAIDNYERTLEIVGEICGEVIAANAESVDHQGPRVENNRVIYADGTRSTSTSRTTPSSSPASSNLPRRRRPGPSRLSSARSAWR